MRDLAPILPKLKIAMLTPNDEVMDRVREAAEWSEKASKNLPISASITGIKLAYAGEAARDPYAGFEARIVPENITLLPKTTDETTGGNAFNERVIAVKKGDTVATILRDQGAAPDEIAAIANVLGPRGRDGGVKEGQKLRILMAPVPGGQRLQPIRVIVANDALDRRGGGAVRYRQIRCRSTSGTAPTWPTIPKTTATIPTRRGVTLYQSVYETALRNQIPRPIIDDLIRIYSYDVDFQRKVQPGDSFEVLYAGEDETPAADSRNDVLFASLTVGGETKKFYRFQSPDDGIVDYYDESGKSAKKFLVRKPVAEGIMRSRLRHPQASDPRLHQDAYRRRLGGADRHADLRVRQRRRSRRPAGNRGYGKYIRIRHTNGYETAYGHMSAFARGIEEGTHVRQGQVIGFVGSTGLSTGSHVHYEILVNGRFVDPMRIKLPRGRVLEGPMLAGFEQERDRLDGIMARKPARVARRASGIAREAGDPVDRRRRADATVRDYCVPRLRAHGRCALRRLRRACR